MANSMAVSKAPGKVLKCSCDHEYQDKRYGKQRRWHNPTMKQADKNGPTTYRCTVCGTLNQG
jgi:hypothetical protein